MRSYGFGIDIGGTTIKMGLFKVDGTLLEKQEIDTMKEDNGKYILEDISKEIKDKMKEKSIHRNDVVGVGIGVPGPVSGDGTVLKCVNLGWGVFNVEETLGEIIDLPVKAGDKLANTLVEDLGEKLGSALATISCICGPEVFVIGGGVSKAGMILVNVIRKYYIEKAFHACEETKFKLAELGNDAGIYGGVKLVLNI